MTIDEFFESEEDLAIHCDTEEKAIKLLEAFDKGGYMWRSSGKNTKNKYTDKTYWNEFKKNTCYSNRRGYGGKAFYQAGRYKILEFEDIEGM